ARALTARGRDRARPALLDAQVAGPAWPRATPRRSPALLRRRTRRARTGHRLRAALRQALRLQGQDLVPNQALRAWLGPPNLQGGLSKRPLAAEAEPPPLTPNAR